MIVVSMTTEEVYREIMRDFVSIKSRSHFEGNILQKEMLRKRLQSERRTICYTTPYRNEWTIIFELDPKGIKTAYYLKSYDSKGMVAYMIQFINAGTRQEDKFVIKYTRHFFDRYNERMGLGFTETSKVVKHFFKNNFEYDLGHSEVLSNGIRCTHFIFKEGIGIGWQHDAKKTLQIKTFVSNNTLSASQRSLAEHIKHGGDDDEFKQVVKVKNLLKAF